MKYIFIWIAIMCLAFGACPKQAVPTIVWKLPNGNVARFYHKSSGFWDSDHPKCIQIEDKSGKIIASYEFAASHSGYEFPELHINSNNSIIWIVDRRRGTIGASVDLRSLKFVDEEGHHPDDVNVTGGRIIPADK